MTFAQVKLLDKNAIKMKTSNGIMFLNVGWVVGNTMKFARNRTHSKRTNSAISS